MNYIEFLIIFFTLNIIIYLFNNKFSKIINVYDLPNTRKIHKSKTPLIGGYIVLLNVILFSILVFANFYNLNSINHIFQSKFQYIIFLTITFSIFLLGAIDDKINLNPNLKLFTLSILIILLLLFDNSLLIKELRISFLSHTIYLGKYSFVFTVLCFLLFINACNMFDGINLQSTGYFIIIILSLIILDIKNLFLLFLLISLILIFKLNFSGKIFMGDSGIYIFSLILSYLIIKNYNSYLIYNADKIFILMMLPGIDMFRLFLFRILKKKNPFFPDKNHIHHLLLNNFSYSYTIIALNIFIILPIFLSYINVSNLYIIIFSTLIYIFAFLVLDKKIIIFD